MSNKQIFWLIVGLFILALILGLGLGAFLHIAEDIMSGTPAK